MSDKFEELSKLMDLYNSGVINKEEMNKLKAQILNIEIKDKETAPPQDEITIETPKELFEEETEKTNDKVIFSLEKANTSKEFNEKNDTIQKLDALLKAGKISEKEHQILVDKTLNPNVNSTPPPLKDNLKKNAETPAAPPKQVEKPQETSKPKVVLTPTVKVKEAQKVKLVPETEVKKETNQVTTEQAVDPSELNATKRKNWTPLFIMLGLILAIGLILILYVNGVFDTGNESDSSTESASGTTYDTRYVMSGSLKLYEKASESADYFHEYPFGAQINFIEGSAIEAEGCTFMEAEYNGKRGWVTITTTGVDLTTSKANIEKIESIVTGTFAQEVLESIGASGKYAILDICGNNDHINANYSDLPPIVLFRSRMGNRNSSSDIKKGINDDPKDMIFAVNKSNGQQWMYLVYFDKQFNYNIAFESQVHYDKIVGFERFSRHAKIDFETQGYYYYDYTLEHDLVKVYYQNKSPRYFNPSASFYDWYEIAYDY